MMERLRSFNPRARAGRDVMVEAVITHIEGFNPRARAGRDLALLAFHLLMSFQSTRPRGARLIFALGHAGH